MKMIIDLTVPLGPKTPLYPGDPAPGTTLLMSLAQGDVLTASKIDLGAHIGTHVDLPGHFLKDGKVLGDYSIDHFVGPAQVIDLTDAAGALTRARLQGANIINDAHILLKTRNSAHLRQTEFFPDYVHLSPSATDYLLSRKPRSIGIDYYSLDPSDSSTFPSHCACASAGVPVFVCLDLSSANAGNYQFAGLPLNFPTLEGAPVRAILWKD